MSLLNAFDQPDRNKLIVLALVGLLYSISIAYVISNIPAQKYRDDFFPRWYTSRQLITGGRSLYDPQNARELQPITPWPEANQYYYYPAYMFILTGPISLIPYPAARVIWTAAGLWSIWISIVLVAATSPRALSLNRLTVLLVFTTLSVPVFQHIIHAQFNAIGLLALAIVYYALFQKKYLLAGFFAGGLLFKPQATMLPVLVILLFTFFKRERWSFWVGFGAVSFLLWLIAESFERNWIVKLVNSLNTYAEITSVVDQFWNPFQIVNILLLGFTAWLVFKNRHCSETSANFLGLLVWSVTVNALMVPLYGMLHMVAIGTIVVMLINATNAVDKKLADRLWVGAILLFIAGLVSFITPLLLAGPTGAQIGSAEVVYKVIFPVAAGLATMPILLKPVCVNIRTD